MYNNFDQNLNLLQQLAKNLAWIFKSRVIFGASWIAALLCRKADDVTACRRWANVHHRHHHDAEADGWSAYLPCNSFNKENAANFCKKTPWYDLLPTLEPLSRNKVSAIGFPSDEQPVAVCRGGIPVSRKSQHSFFTDEEQLRTNRNRVAAILATKKKGCKSQRQSNQKKKKKKEEEEKTSQGRRMQKVAPTLLARKTQRPFARRTPGISTRSEGRVSSISRLSHGVQNACMETLSALYYNTTVRLSLKAF